MSENNKYTVLIAEDNDATRQMMTAVLENKGYDVQQAIDGGTAMDVVRSQKVDLALVDLHMSPKGGFDFVKYVQTEGYNLPMVMITGDQGTDLLMEARKHGVTQLLQKPVDAGRLVSLVERVIQKFVK
tara:strand:- start:589 stop:972 length:384 start_codon:yes stop_codon:yes gene_type:complete